MMIIMVKNGLVVLRQLIQKQVKLNFDSLLQIITDDRINPNSKTDTRTKSIDIYDDYSYFIAPVNGKEVFDNYEELYKTIQDSKFKSNMNGTQDPTIDSLSII